MKIAYVAQLEAERETGVNKKLVDQISAWVTAGHDVHLFMLSPSPTRWKGWGTTSTTIASYTSYLGRVTGSNRLADAVLAFAPDVIYFRLATCYPGFIRLARTGRMIVEVNSDFDREARVRMNRAKYWLYISSVRSVLRHSIGAVSVARSVGERLQREGLATLVLGNSIDMSRFPVSPTPHNAAPHLLFLGSENCVWHGVDKLKDAATRFPEWTFDVVGLTPEEFSEPFPNNVLFHGFLPGEKYRALLETADVAFGTLALHRKGMTDNTSLKVREYLAAGVPVISGHPDPDFETEAPYLLELPNCESNVRDNLDRISSFVTRWAGRRVDRASVQHLDVSVKEAARISFFKRRLTAALGSEIRREP